MKKPVCKLPAKLFTDDDRPPIEKCGTDQKGMTLCEGDRVERLPIREGGKLIKFKNKGTVMGVQMGADNRGKKMLGARVCFDNDQPGDLAYNYLFVELRKLKK